MADIDQVAMLSDSEEILKRHSLLCISPDDAKYSKASQVLASCLSSDAEWRACVRIQGVLLEVRRRYGLVTQDDIAEFKNAELQIDTLNIALLENNVTKHDQLAVIEEIGRFVSPRVKAQLHPGTTSYDILDTARSYLFKKAWFEVLRPEVAQVISKLSLLAERYLDQDGKALENGEPMPYLQTGRTHIQNTSPVPFGTTLAGYAARLAERTKRCDIFFDDLRGKISGIVGTGASVEMVVGEDMASLFEEHVLRELGLLPDPTATQIVQKERLSDVGHGLTTLMWVLADFADDIRLLYSSAINEVTSRDNAERLGGSSADASKNNPINFENVAGKAVVVESGMRVLYAMIDTDLQRDLRGSVQGRYQPQLMMVEVFESFGRISRSLDQLSVNQDVMARNLESVRSNPSEAMVAILRGEQWVHCCYGVGHDFVKEMVKIAKKEDEALIRVCLRDPEFAELYDTLSDDKRDILNGKLELYVGKALDLAVSNLEFARDIISTPAT